MIVYHGSNHNFKKFRVSDSLVERQSTRENEGKGIYFTTDIETARSYGKWLYTVAINDKYLLDFRKKPVCNKYITCLNNYVKKNTGVYLSSWIKLDDTINRMYLGGLSIWGLSRELELLLDSCEAWYLKMTESNRRKIIAAVRRFNKEHLKVYMYNYSIKSTGVSKT